jgi:lipopolysaccharide cholinephosphotransferase
MYLTDYIKNKFYILFERFDLVCKNHNINYFIIAGTLLGAVRHHEMIPWDNDIDVGILEEDLEKLQKIDLSLYGLQQRGVKKDYIGKIFFIDEYDNGDKYDSVFIDIFVFEEKNNKYQYTHDFALNSWKSEFFYKDELFPLKPYTFKNLIVMGPNDSLSYSNRAWGKNWMNTPISVFLNYLIYPEKIFNQTKMYDKYVDYIGISKRIHFFILNMDKDVDRYNNTKKQLEFIIYKPSYSKVKGIDGRKMSDDKVCKEILFPRQELLGKEFEHIQSKQKWIYDGVPSTSFPSLNLNSHYGTKGLTLTNILAFKEAQKSEYKDIEWFCILEDDAIITNDSFRSICDFINNPKNSHNDIIVLDIRKFGGTTGVLYNKRILETLLTDLHPLSDFSIQFEKKMKRSALWDWKLYDYISKEKKDFIFYDILPCIKESGADSTINLKE